MVLQGYARAYRYSPIIQTDCQHMAVDKGGTKLDKTDSQAIRSKVDALLIERGMSTMDLIRRIPMSKGGFYTMWDAGSITLGTLVNIARVLQVPAGSLLSDQHRGEVLRIKPGARPYVEDRIEQLESKVKQLETQLKKKTT